MVEVGVLAPDEAVDGDSFAAVESSGGMAIGSLSTERRNPADSIMGRAAPAAVWHLRAR
jgi:hypothetical protein